MKITEDFIGNETKELTKTKIATILRWWGFNPDSYSTWGNARVDMNNILSGSSSNTISDRERASSFLSKINYINDTDTVISDMLFASNEPGVWYDPSDLSTLFQDAAGTVPVTAVEQPVGLMLDKSGRGNHASQATATSRPVLSARVNLLTKTEQFGDGVWSKFNGSVSANSTAAPNGIQTADLFTENMVNGPHMVRAVNVNFASNPYRFSVFIKPNGRNLVAVGLETSTYDTFGRIFDLATGTSTDNYGNAPANHSIQALDDGWFLLTIENTQQIKDIGIVLVQSGTHTTYQGDGTSGIYICGASLVPADQAHLPYQRVNTATDYDTAGFPHYLKCDGVDDWLVTPTITPGIDKVQVFAGVRKLSDAVASSVVELGSTYWTSDGFSIQAPGHSTAGGMSSPFANYYAAVGDENGTQNSHFGVYGTQNIYPSPTTNVVAALFDRGAAPLSKTNLRVNGTVPVKINGDFTGTAVTGNMLTAPLYIGSRGGTTLRFNGHLYSLIVRFGSNLPIETIEQVEKYINGLTKAY